MGDSMATLGEHRSRTLLLALLLSGALHTLALFAVEIPEGQATPREEPPIEVALLQPDEAAMAAAVPEESRPRQMVAPPDTVNDQTPERARFESDRDNTVERETVRPGVPNPGPPPVAQKRPHAPSSPQQAQAARA